MQCCILTGRCRCTFVLYNIYEEVSSLIAASTFMNAVCLVYCSNAAVNANLVYHHVWFSLFAQFMFS